MEHIQIVVVAPQHEVRVEKEVLDEAVSLDRAWKNEPARRAKSQSLVAGERVVQILGIIRMLRQIPIDHDLADLNYELDVREVGNIPVDLVEMGEDGGPEFVRTITKDMTHGYERWRHLGTGTRNTLIDRIVFASASHP